MAGKVAWRPSARGEAARGVLASPPSRASSQFNLTSGNAKAYGAQSEGEVLEQPQGWQMTVAPLYVGLGILASFGAVLGITTLSDRAGGIAVLIFGLGWTGVIVCAVWWFFAP